MPRSFAANWPALPKVEVVGLSKEMVEEIFWDAITQVRADLAGIHRSSFHSAAHQAEIKAHGASTSRFSCAMMPTWIVELWNGSGTMLSAGASRSASAAGPT